MAGTHTAIGTHEEDGSAIRMAYTFEFGDEWDAVDWGEYVPGVDGPTAAEEQAFVLSGDVEVWVEGPGTWRGALHRGQSQNEWRNTDQTFPDGMTAADGVLSFRTGGPVRQIADITKRTAQRLA